MTGLEDFETIFLAVRLHERGVVLPNEEHTKAKGYIEKLDGKYLRE